MTDLKNTTQIPHILIRNWMPKLQDVEFRVLMVIADQTYGWVKHRGSKERKTRDWISMSQLVERTGRGKTAVSCALGVLIDKYDLVKVYDSTGAELRRAGARMRAGKMLIMGINLHPFQRSLFTEDN